jgi:hypothetical protein
MNRPALFALLSAMAATAASAEEPLATSNGKDPPTVAAGASAAATEIAPVQPPALRDGPAGDDRRVHGEAGVAVGTGGYRSAYLAVSGPLGDRGYGGVAVGATRGRFYGPPFIPGDTLHHAERDCVTVERPDGPGNPAAPPTACSAPLIF